MRGGNATATNHRARRTIFSSTNQSPSKANQSPISAPAPNGEWKNAPRDNGRKYDDESEKARLERLGETAATV
jgi:hypothetical protein